MTINTFGTDIISPKLSNIEFAKTSLEVFHHQMLVCQPYREYVELLGVEVVAFEDIPFLPIEIFKTRKIYGGERDPQSVFTSSGTTGAETSKHSVASLELYERSFTEGFHKFYGQASEYSIFALLPSYMEREGSSLIYMVEHLCAQNPNKGGFFLDDLERLTYEIQASRKRGEKIILIGVTFALMDFAEQFPQDLSGVIVMETGGMKGRRREIAREELHQKLCAAFNIPSIHSEYGMTEMLSQCYSSGSGIFHAPNWVQISTRSLQNPLQRSEKIGGINIIDLANIHSCSFLATGDTGEVHADGSFEIHGRIESAQIRGCNMLTE